VIAGASFAAGANLSGFVALFFAKTGSTTTIHAGETVAWLNPARTPHTVTFGPEPADPNTIVNATNGHATIGSDVSGGVSSGLFGVARPTGTVFSITFTAPGTFHYICALHDESGMVGTVVVLPANSGLGGKGFGVTPTVGGTQLSWQSGTTQTGYALVRLSNGTFTILASLDRNATSYLDTTAPSGFNCYWLLALGAGPTGTSDLECATRGFQSATNVPQLFTLRLNQGGTATLEWAAPVESTQDGYTLVDFSGGKQQLGATATSATVPMSGFSCFAVQAKRAGAVVGTTEVLCAQPGLSNLGS
jgi:plastocyanin